MAGVAALALLALGCGDGEDGAASSDTPLVDTVVGIRVLDNSYRPARLDVAVGTTIEWTNRGRSDHDIVPIDTFGWGVEPDAFAPRDVYRHRFTEPGIYAYYCSLHGTETAGMGGTIIVAG